MTKQQLKRIAAGFWAAAFVAMSSMTALAADAVEITGSGSGADDTKVVVGYQDKDLFSNMKELMPGDQISNTVAMANLSSRPVTLYMKAYSEFESADGGKTAFRKRTETSAAEEFSVAEAEGKTFRGDILDHAVMTLMLGEKTIYKGTADGSRPETGYPALTNDDGGICLGSFAAGQRETLTITLKLPGAEFDNSYADSFDAVDWIFYAEGTTPGSNEGSNGGHGGGGGSSGGKHTVSDSVTPLDPWTGGGDSNILITDPGMPISLLPKLGDEGMGIQAAGMLLALLAAVGAYVMRKHCCH